MKDNEFVEFEDRYYLSPTVSRDEQVEFIDTLRDTQQKHTEQINTDTYNLGTHIPSQFGGLSGGEDTFIAQYQTPQTNQTVAELRQAAQQTALNQALSNLQNAYKKRYNDAVSAYQKRAATPSSTNNPTTQNPAGDVTLEGNKPDAIGSGAIAMPAEHTTTIVGPNGRTEVWGLDSNGKITDYIGFLKEDGTIDPSPRDGTTVKGTTQAYNNPDADNREALQIGDILGNAYNIANPVTPIWSKPISIWNIIKKIGEMKNDAQ